MTLGPLLLDFCENDLSLLYHAATFREGGPTAKQYHVHTVDGAIFMEEVAKKYNPAPLID